MEKMKILICGTRGIPDILGGVETHCQALYPLLNGQEYSIDLIRRTAYVNESSKRTTYKGIKLIDLYSPKMKSIEAIVHSFIAVLYAKRNGYSYMHIHAIGPSLVIPFARLLGLKVVMTHHGPDYDRQKWGLVAKTMLKLGEWCAAKYSNEIIVISYTIKRILMEKYNRHDTHLIHNGVKMPQKAINCNFIESFGLEPKKYIIAVGRFVPEKGFHDLIEAYKRINIDCKLVLVGDTDHKSHYSETLKKQAENNNVVLTGFITGEKLNEIFSHAAMFVMPSYHEGLPIALLEAMSYNLNVVVSNIPANLEVDLDDKNYFSVGNIPELSCKIIERFNNREESDYGKILIEKYNWEIIANQTSDIYSNLK